MARPQTVGQSGTVGFGFGAADVPEVLSGQAVLASSYNITADTTWESTGLRVRLPGPGTYEIKGAVTGFQLNTAGSASLLARFWDETRGAAVADSEIRVCGTSANVTQLLTSFMFNIVTVDRETWVRLEAYRTAGGGGWTNSTIYSVAGDSRTRIGYLKIAP